ncbi:DNA pilot protein [Microviridae sp.]|nr:DNA pilot protein [Microviridae sp.]
MSDFLSNLFQSSSPSDFAKPFETPSTHTLPPIPVSASTVAAGANSGSSGISSIIGSFLKPLGSAIGTVASGLLSLMGANMQNKSAQQAAREQMSFQERMSNTAYQRAISDMRAAGINPILAYSQGGASTPGGASYVPQNELQASLTSAMETRRLNAELQNMYAQNANLKSQTNLNKSLSSSAMQDAKLKSNSAKVAGVNEQILQQNLIGARLQGKIDDSLIGGTGRVLKTLRGR